METFLYQESESPMMNITNMTLKNKITIPKNLIEMRQMTLYDTKFDIKKLLDALQNEKQIDLIVNLVRIFSKDFGMELGISKCTTLIMKRVITSRKEGIQLPNDEVIKNVEDGE